MTTAEAREILEAAELAPEIKEKLLDKLEKHGLSASVQEAINKAIDQAVKAIEGDLARLADLETDAPDNPVEISFAQKLMNQAFEKYENEVDQIEHAVHQTTKSAAKKKDAEKIKKLKAQIQEEK